MAKRAGRTSGFSRKYGLRSGKATVQDIDVDGGNLDIITSVGGGDSISINHDATGSTEYAIDIDTESTGACINIAMAATTTPVLKLDTSSFQSLDCATTATERIVIQSGTNTRYLRVYSGA